MQKLKNFFSALNLQSGFPALFNPVGAQRAATEGLTAAANVPAGFGSQLGRSVLTQLIGQLTQGLGTQIGNVLGVPSPTVTKEEEEEDKNPLSRLGTPIFGRS